MKIAIEFLNDERTKAQVTIMPGWLGRLLRRKPKSGVAKQVFDHAYGMQWRWSTTNREIDSSLLRALELQDVEPLPDARVVVTPARARTFAAELLTAAAGAEALHSEKSNVGVDILAINGGRRRP